MNKIKKINFINNKFNSNNKCYHNKNHKYNSNNNGNKIKINNKDTITIIKNINKKNINNKKLKLKKWYKISHNSNRR